MQQTTGKNRGKSQIEQSARESALHYFSPVSGTPGFPKALARTLLDLRLAAVSTGRLLQLPATGSDLALLLERLESLLDEAGASDRAALFEIATAALSSAITAWPPMPLLLLDVPFDSEVEAEFLWALVENASAAMVTIPAGDSSTVTRLEKRGVQVRKAERAEEHDLSQLARFTFSR